jgi:hypothetical protein
MSDQSNPSEVDSTSCRDDSRPPSPARSVSNSLVTSDIAAAFLDLMQAAIRKIDPHDKGITDFGLTERVRASKLEYAEVREVYDLT